MDKDLAYPWCLSSYYIDKATKDPEFGISDQFAVLKNFCIFNSIEFDISKMSYTTVYKLCFYKCEKRKVYTLDIRDTNLRKHINDIIDELQKEMLFMLPRNIACDFDGDVLAVVPVSNDYLPEIKKVIFNNPATIVLWSDGTKTIVKCQDGDIYDKEKGLALAICKKAIGTNNPNQISMIFSRSGVIRRIEYG